MHNAKRPSAKGDFAFLYHGGLASGQRMAKWPGWQISAASFSIDHVDGGDAA